MWLTGWDGAAFDEKAAAPSRAVEGQKIVRAHGLDARQRAQACEKVREERAVLVETFVLRFGQNDSHRQHIRRVEAGTLLLHARETLEQKPRARQEHERD